MVPSERVTAIHDPSSETETNNGRDFAEGEVDFATRVGTSKEIFPSSSDEEIFHTLTPPLGST